MPPKKIINNTVYIIDCNSSLNANLENFYSIYATKVFFRATKLKSPDRNKVILIKENDFEPLTEWSSYQIQQLKEIRDSCHKEPEGKPDNRHYTFLKALRFAVSSLENIVDPKNIIVRQIVIFSDLQHLPMSDKDKYVEQIQGALYHSLATIYYIGVDTAKTPKIRGQKDIKTLMKLDNVDDVKSPEFTDTLGVIRRLASNNTMILNANIGYHLLFSHREALKTPFPWYVGLGIGSDFRLPVMCFKTIRKHFNVRMRRGPVEGQRYTTDKGWFDLNTHEQVSMDNVVKGYKYNGKFVTFTREQEAEMENKKRTSKCLQIVAFVAADQIPIHLYAFENSMHKVRPDKRNPRYKHIGFRLLMRALREKNMVAIVKRVYNSGNRPNLFAMFPCPEHKTKKYLMMAQIPYAHQFKDRFHRGVKCKLENTQPELKENVFGFLDAMTSGNLPDGQPVHPLTENMKFNENRSRQFRFLAKKHLEEEPGNPPRFDIHPFLKKQAQPYADNLLQFLKP